jgi:hypothetical protein
MKRTRGCWKRLFEAVVKSLSRVPMPSTTSAADASTFAAAVPVTPSAPTHEECASRMAPLPACVTETGIPVAAANFASASAASL